MYNRLVGFTMPKFTSLDVKCLCHVLFYGILTEFNFLKQYSYLLRYIHVDIHTRIYPGDVDYPNTIYHSNSFILSSPLTRSSHLAKPEKQSTLLVRLRHTHSSRDNKRPVFGVRLGIRRVHFSISRLHSEIIRDLRRRRF